MVLRTFGWVTPFVRRGAVPHTPPRQHYAAAGENSGTIVLVHGGGWLASTQAHLDALQVVGEGLAAWGWDAHAISLRAGRAGVLDILNALTDIDDGKPVLLYGESSGGHLALLASADRAELVDGVITAASPTTLTALPGLGRFTRRPSAFAEDTENLAQFSPLERATEIDAPVFMTYAAEDTLVSPAHAVAFARAHTDTVMVELPAGDAPWQHSSVDQSAIIAAAQTLRAWLSEITVNTTAKGG